MKRIPISLIAIATALLGGGVGFLSGALIGRTVWTIGDGVPMGVCLATQIAREQGAMTPSEIDRVVNQARDNVQRTARRVVPADFNFNCPDALGSFSK